VPEKLGYAYNRQTADEPEQGKEPGNAGPGEIDLTVLAHQEKVKQDKDNQCSDENK
jgi:hypothetical protein